MNSFRTSIFRRFKFRLVFLARISSSIAENRFISELTDDPAVPKGFYLGATGLAVISDESLSTILRVRRAFGSIGLSQGNPRHFKVLLALRIRATILLERCSFVDRPPFLKSDSPFEKKEIGRVEGRGKESVCG